MESVRHNIGMMKLPLSECVENHNVSHWQNLQNVI